MIAPYRIVLNAKVYGGKTLKKGVGANGEKLVKFLNKPRKVAVVGKHAQSFKRLLAGRGYSFTEKPELVFCFGGDGTILFSETRFPGVPKVAIKHSDYCTRCNVGSPPQPLSHAKMFYCTECVDKALDALDGRVKIKEHFKLDGTAYTSRGVFRDTALNEVQVHNNSPLHAVRGDVFVDGERVFRDFVSDGAIVATLFGSTGYFYSVSRETFEEGIGVALNNSTRPEEPLVVDEDSTIKIVLTRRHGRFVVDNHAKTVQLDTGDKVIVKKSKQVARFVEF